MGSLSQSCRVTHLQLAAVPSQLRHMSVCTICQSADVSKTSTCLHRKTPLSPRSLRHHHTLAVLANASCRQDKLSLLSICAIPSPQVRGGDTACLSEMLQQTFQI